MEFFDSHRQKLVVAADDFGVSPRANRNILYLLSLGKIDRVAVMAYGTMSQQEMDELMRSGAKIDIHLDILHEFHEERRERSSALLRIFEFMGKFFFGKISPKAVARDWHEQIDRFQELFGRKPDGINSHEHVHFFPPFFRVALHLAKEHDIPYIRFGNSTPLKHNKPVAQILHILRRFNQKRYARSGRVSSGSLVSLDWIKDIDKFLETLPEGTIEIACHPELADDFVKIKKYF